MPARTAAALILCVLLATISSGLWIAEPVSASAAEPEGEELLVYIGTYTSGKSEGIYILRMDLASGRLTRSGVVSGVANPSFLAVHPNRRFLYAVNEVGDYAGQMSGAVSAFAIQPGSGHLTLLNRQPSGGAGPCHLVVDPTGRNVLVANYGGGSVASLPILMDGRLGEATAFVQHEGSSVNARRQSGPHAHSINVDPTGRFAFAADLGLDKVLVYRLDASRGALAPNDPPSVSVTPGGGPRHFAVHPGGRWAYTNNEMTSTVTVFSYDPVRGVLASLQTISTLPAGFGGGNSTAEIQVAPSGRSLYVSNRGHDSIAVFAIDPDRGTLTQVENEPTQGKVPRSFGIDPTSSYLLAANQNSDTVVVFRIDSRTGQLEPTGHVVEVPTPVCVQFLPIPR